MRPSPLLLVLPSAVFLAACLAPAEPLDSDPPAAVEEPPVDDGGMCEAEDSTGVCEDVGEAEDAITACQLACVGLLGLGCAGVIGACIAGEAPTFGGVTFPCIAALSIACSATGNACLTYCGI